MTRTVFLAPTRTAIVGLCLLVTGCTRGNEAPPAGDSRQEAPPPSSGQPTIAPGQRVSIEFQSEPDPPRSGDNTFEVAVKQPDGSPITDATVTAVFSMPAMPSMNMPAMRSDASLTHVGNGTYRGMGQLSMGGTWNVVITVSRGGEQLGANRFSIVAK